MHHAIQGCYAALPTPFHQGRLDLERYGELIERIAELGADGIVVAGTTGEVPTLNGYEQRSLIHHAVEVNRGRLSLIAGIGTNCTRSSVEMARFAAESGADGLMAVTPYYNCPTRRGLLLHFGQIADASDLPLMLYNVPSRTGTDLVPAVAAELAARHDNIVAIKETTRSLERVRELVQTSDLAVLCGEDTLIYEYCMLGAVGAVSVVANLSPRHVSGIVHGAAGALDTELARELQAELVDLNAALRLDVNPVPLKAAMADLGLCQAEVRAPLAPLDIDTRTELRRLLARATSVHALEPEPQPARHE